LSLDTGSSHRQESAAASDKARPVFFAIIDDLDALPISGIDEPPSWWNHRATGGDPVRWNWILG